MKLLNILWKKWRHVGKIIGNFQALIIFTVFYFVILWIVGIVVSVFSDPLLIKKKRLKSNYTDWKHSDKTLIDAQKPY